MKTGSATNTIINTNKISRKPIKANCNRCVNNSKRGCRFGWVTIQGKCTRFGIAERISKEESKAIRNRNSQMISDRKNIKITTIEKLSKVLETNLTFEQVCNCRKPTLLGNMKFAIKRVGSVNNPIIQVIYSDRIVRFKLIR